jgi:hypothetical protein
LFKAFAHKFKFICANLHSFCENPYNASFDAITRDLTLGKIPEKYVWMFSAPRNQVNEGFLDVHHHLGGRQALFQYPTVQRGSFFVSCVYLTFP